MKVVVTGVAGFLGSHIAEYFIALGHDVIGIDSLVGGELKNVPHGVSFYRIDLNDLEELTLLFESADLVYHCACTAYEGLSVFSPSLIVSNTFQNSVNVGVACIRNNVRRLIYCSSMARYGSQAVNPFTEDMICAPQDPYGIAKYSAELVLKNLADVHGLEVVVAVPHNIIGPRQKYDDPYRNVASIMINLMLQGRQPVIYGDGKQVRCFSDIDDDIGCLVAMAESDRAVGDIFNIGPDESPVTILKLAEIIAEQLNFNLDPIFMPGRPQEVKFATCSADKIRKIFGYETTVSLEESIKKMIGYIRQNGVKKFEYHLPIEIRSNLTPKTWSERLF